MQLKVMRASFKA